jgi:hypothetical protein
MNGGVNRKIKIKNNISFTKGNHNAELLKNPSPLACAFIGVMAMSRSATP